MDIATIIGIFLGGFLIFWSIAIGAGGLKLFLDIPSVAVTIGGMLCSTLIHFSLPQFLSIFAIIKKTIITKVPKQKEIIQQMVNFAAINRRDGALALEQELKKIKEGFLVHAMQMLIDGKEADDIRDILGLEIDNLRERHGTGKQILEFMGASAPAFGMIGTLIGLVQMLCNMSDPSSIGSGMAVALLTTFYGAFVSNLLLIPLAGKLGIYSKAETTVMEMIVEGVVAIADGENPTAIREKMHTFMSHSNREDIKATV